MISEMSKRFLSFLLAMAMLVSMVPVQVFATETEEHDHDNSETVAQQQLDTESETTVAPVTEEPLQTEAVTQETQAAESGENEQVILPLIKPQQGADGVLFATLVALDERRL